ncbi:MAG: FAD-binding oxidoreductase [Pseudomonadota bacterium]
MARKIIVIGGGVIGTSIAWHLAKAEAGDITLVERDRLGAGTTWHSAGNITWMANSDTSIRAAFETLDEVAKEADQETGWLRTGRLYLARTPETLAWMERQAPLAEAAGIESRLIEPRDALALNPLIDPDALVGTWLNGASGRVNPADLTAAFARAARRRGVAIHENCAVEAVRVDGGKISGVASSDGDLDADLVIVACGLWSRRLLSPLDITLAQWGCEHFYIIQRTDPPLPRTMPSFVSPDDSIYGREEVGGLLVGCFDTDALTLDLDNGAPPDGFAFSLLDENWDQFGPYGERAVRLFPGLQNAPVHRFVNGPESFTPDGEPLLGPLAEVDGLYVATAFNSAGVTYSAYAGQLMSDLVTGSAPRFDPAPCDPLRFGDKGADEAWLRGQVAGTPAGHYHARHT